MYKKLVHLTLVITAIALTCKAQTPNIVLTALGTGLTSPVDVVNCGDDRLFVVQQGGIIKIYKNGAFLPTPFLNLSSIVLSSGNEEGLLGLAFSPNYATDSSFYVNYTAGASPGASKIARYKVSATNPDSALFSSGQILLSLTQPYTNHNGGNLMFGPDGYLYAGFGDGGSGGDPQANGQNKNVKLAKMLRIDVSGSGAYTIPPTNPFVGVANTQPEIWAYGLRNPWRWSFDRVTGDMWIGDVGQDLWEEIDRQPASSTGGENYGWKCREGLNSYSTSGNCGTTTNFVSPIYNYSHSTANGCSVTGGFVYRGAKYKNLYGKYVYADYCNNKIYMLRETTPGVYINSTLLDVAGQGFSSFGEDRYGELYLTDRDNSKLYGISDTSSCSPVANLNVASSVTTCDSIYTFKTPYNPVMLYQWSYNGVTINGADSNVYVANQNGTYSVTVANFTNGCITNSDTVTLNLNAVITVSFTGLDSAYCVNYAPSTLVGNPAGGTFTGAGVSGTTFDPTIAGIGVDTITYTYSANGCTASYQIATTVSACLGIDHLPNTSTLRVVPNPNNGSFNINFFNDKDELLEVTVENYLSQNIYKNVHRAVAGDNAIAINLANAKPGLYLLSVKKGSSISKLQVLVK